MKHQNRPEREWKRDGLTNRHHLTPRSRGGKSTESNLLEMDYSRHCAWHLLFKNLTLDEIIALLLRVKQMKIRRRKRC